MPLGREHKRDALELILLSVLSDQQLYGYAIIKQIAARSDGDLRVSAGVLYPILHQLERSKLIASRWEEIHSDRKPNDHESDGRRRKWYRITVKGRRRLSQRIAAHRARQTMIESFLPPDDRAFGKEATSS